MFGYSIANFEMVSDERDIQFTNLGSFKIIIYGAYNAFGLIGSEQNGIAILDNNRMSVLCDLICPQSTGYFGASPQQKQEFTKICSMAESEFQAFVNSNDRSRYDV